MKTFNELAPTSQLENGAILPANNAANTVTYKITYSDLSDQIRGSLVSGIALNGTTLTVTHADDDSIADADVFTTQDTWTAMSGATESENGTAGYVPAPPSNGYNTKFLRADGTWASPSDLDTHYASSTVVGDSNDDTTNVATATNGNVYLNHVENGVVTSAHNITGSGAATVTAANGVITVSSTDTDTHYASSTVVGDSSSGTTNAATADNGDVYLNHVENDTVTSSHNITGSGATTVTADDGVITISSSDTHYASSTVVGGANSATTNGTEVANGNVYLNHVENGAVVSAHNITGLGATTVTAANGAITINSTDTDTHYASSTVVGDSNDDTTDATTVTNGNVYLNHVENGSVTSAHNVVGSGATTVTSASGVITISSTDTNTHYESSTVVASTDTGDTDSDDVTNGNVYLNHIEDGSVVSSHNITGSGATTVTADDGVITISSTDTHYASDTVVGADNDDTTNATATNGNVHLNHIENNTVISSHSIIGSGATSVTSNSNGDITISSTDTDTHYASSTVVGGSNSATTNAATVTNGNVYLNHIENSEVVSNHNITGSGATSVTAADGVITISSTDTDTHYASSTVVGASNSATTDAATVTDGNVHLNHVENGAVVSSHGITGSGATTVTAADGTVTITSTDTWTAMTGATAEENGTAGYVPAPPSTGYNTKYLRADGTWATVEQISVDNALSDSSTNPVQNSVIYNALAAKADTSSLGTAAAKDIQDTYDETSEDAISGKGVAAALASLPDPMIFKGSLGSGGTIETLPAASNSGASKNVGFTYKVITDGTYRGLDVKVGDTVISNGTDWILVPSGDEPMGTVTSVGLTQGTGMSISGGPITSSGNITVAHGDTSDQVSVANSGRSYIQSVTLDDFGHVTALTTATETVTDTHYSSSSVVGASDEAIIDATTAANGNVYLNHVENGSVTSSHKITGSGATTVTSANGVITITSTDSDTWTANSSSAAGYVASGEGQANKVWKTDDSGNPAWRDEAAASYSTVSKSAAGLCPALPDEETTTKYLRQDGTWVTPPDNNTTYSEVSKQAAGLCPALPDESTTTKYLRQDGTWQVPPDNNTWTAMTGATAEENGTAGYVPAPPSTGYDTKYLRADGTWQVPPGINTTYTLDTITGTLDCGDEG